MKQPPTTNNQLNNKGFTFYPRALSLRAKRGFTLIELLVVVAIIGVLATIVLASLNSARGKAKDAAIKQSLSQFQKQAELQYLDTGNYNTICDAGTISGNIFADAYGRGTADGTILNLCLDENGRYYGIPPIALSSNTSAAGIDPNGSAWAATISLSTGDWFCVDSLGNSKIDLNRQISTSPFDKSC
jgi:prepilin-type N-terminal cleavage/methylation domain-containing protein